jgi:hypothetical protein
MHWSTLIHPNNAFEKECVEQHEFQRPPCPRVERKFDPHGVDPYILHSPVLEKNVLR